MDINSTTGAAAGLIQVAPGIVVRSPITVEAVDCQGYDVRLEVIAEPAAEDRAGRLVCRELVVRQRDGGGAVTLAGVRTIPVASLVRQGVAGHVMTVESQSEDGTVTMEGAWMPDNVAATGPTDEALRWVAHVYRLALVAGDPPTKAVQQTMGLAPATAGRWVATARARGLLGASEGPGKAGG